MIFKNHEINKTNGTHEIVFRGDVIKSDAGRQCEAMEIVRDLTSPHRNSKARMTGRDGVPRRQNT